MTTEMTTSTTTKHHFGNSTSKLFDLTRCFIMHNEAHGHAHTVVAKPSCTYSDLMDKFIDVINLEKQKNDQLHAIDFVFYCSKQERNMNPSEIFNPELHPKKNGFCMIKLYQVSESK